MKIYSQTYVRKAAMHLIGAKKYASATAVTKTSIMSANSSSVANMTTTLMLQFPVVLH